MKLKVIIAGGGTGGHIFPAVAIGNALVHMYPGTELLFVGAKGKMEMEKVPKEGFKIIGLDIVGFNRSHLWKNIFLPMKILKSWSKASAIIKDFKPDVVVGVGGYASFPMLSAAQRKNIPTLIQEQNSYAGKTNKILSKKAKAICVAYENMEVFFPKEKLMLTGNPVRAKIAYANEDKTKSLATFGLGNNKKTLLIVGGSLGAKAINEAIAAGLNTLIENGLQLIWQTGKPFLEEAQKAAKPYEGKVIVSDFIYNMETAYSAADIVVSRAGALAIAELCIVGKPVIFVPYPFAAEDHQTSNAMALVNNNAALMIKNDDAAQHLINEIVQLSGNEGQQEAMSKNIKSLAIKNADEIIATKIKEIAQS